MKRVLKRFSQFRVRKCLRTLSFRICLPVLTCLLFTSLLRSFSLLSFPSFHFLYFFLLAPDKHTLIHLQCKLIVSPVTLYLLVLASSISLKCERAVCFLGHLEMDLKGSNWMPEQIPLHSRSLVHYLLPSWSNMLLSRLPSSSLPMLWMPGDWERAGGQATHHIWTHQSSSSSRDTKLCSLTKHSQA